MRSLLLVGGGILIGVGLSYTEATIRAEKKIREAEADLWNQWVSNLEPLMEAESPAETEMHLIHPNCFDSMGNRLYEPPEEELTFSPEGSILEQEQTLPPGYVEEYVQKAAVYGDSAHMVQSQPMEIIDDEQYSEEDGRAKEQIQVFMGEGEPYFVQDGMVIEDWQEKIGDNILVMFYQNFTPDHTEPRVIYVRNNDRGEDFEVLQEMGP
jgi:hypothetical protein